MCPAGLTRIKRGPQTVKSGFRPERPDPCRPRDGPPAAGEPVQRESMEYDVVIVGGGPSGLACAIRLKQLAAQQGRETSVCVLEKGSEIGAHILSGAVIDPRALNELFPDWKERHAPLDTEAREDRVLLLTEQTVLQAAGAAVPAQRRQLRGEPRQPLPLAGDAGRGTRRGDLPRLRRRGSAVPRGRQREGRRDRRHGHRQGRPAHGEPPAAAWSCTRARRCSPKAAAAR